MLEMKHSIAKKLILRIACLMIVSFIIIFAYAYHSVSKNVSEGYERYTKAVVSIYGDLIAYEAERKGIPLNLECAKDADFFGHYMSQYYFVDFCYLYTVNEAMDSITYISFSRNKEKVNKDIFDHMTGYKMAYSLLPKELEVWEGREVYCTGKSDEIERAIEIEYAVSDKDGNRVMAGSGISLDFVEKTIMREFSKAAAIILAVFFLIAALLYLLIKRKVTQPTRNISRIMAEYISDGKRSKRKLDDKGEDEFAMIAGAFNKMTDDIDQYLGNIRSLSREQERRQAEIDIASSIQMGLLPPGHSEIGDCEIYAMLKPAKTVGGDLYDYQRIDDSHILTVVGDVSGKGIPAALFMTATLTLIRQYARLGQSPAEILRNTNESLVESNPNMLFATAFVAVYDTTNRTLRYSNAGHNPPFLIHGTPSLLEGAKNTLMGLFEDEEYSEESIVLSDGDTLVLYTDGVNEAVNDKGEFYGMERFAEALRSAGGHQAVLPVLQESLSSFSGDCEQHDDITALTLTVRGGKPAETGRKLLLNVDLKELARIREIILSSELPKKTQLELCVAAEEIFVNICSYAFEGKDKSGERIGFFFNVSDSITMRFTDNGIEYDPRKNVTDADDYDIDTQIGGLGKLIAFTVADEVSYEYINGNNILTITKKLF